MTMGIGIHVVDTAHYMLKLGKPSAAVAGGGIYFYKDGRDTPDTLALIIDYPNEATVTFVAEALTAPGLKTPAGVELRGTGGKLYGERYETKRCLEYTPNSKFSTTPAAVADGSAPSAAPMLLDWCECIKSRRRTLANEEEAYWSTMACFMAAMAFRRKTRIAWDDKWSI
jgi:predicted dehydrogenase